MRNRQRDRHLGQILKQGDPAAGAEGLSREESLRIQQRIRQELHLAVPLRNRSRFLWAAAVGLALLVAVQIWRGRPVEIPGESESPSSPAVHAALTTDSSEGSGRQPREIHFVTANGTRVIWRLDPGFDL